MATLYITEFQIIPNLRGATPIAPMPPLFEQALTIGAGSTPSAAFKAATTYVRLHTDAICSVAFGAAPTATAAQMRLSANSTEYFAVNGGDKVAVISNT